MATAEQFARECQQVARDLRRLPKELRRALAKRAKDEVAEPVRADIQQAWRGPHARALASATKARADADPTIVVGGGRKILRGGASGRDLVFGNEFGAGARRGTVREHTRRGRPVRLYKRRTTAQFTAPDQGAVYGTIAADMPEILAAYAEIVVQTFDEVVTDG